MINRLAISRMARLGASAFVLGSIGCAGHGGGVFDTVDQGTAFVTQIGATPVGPFSIYLRDTTHETVTQITQVGTNAFEGDFNAVTGMYVFVQTPPPGTGNLVSNLYVIPKGSLTPVQKTFTAFNHHNPRFSPDGNWIVFSEDVTPPIGTSTSSAIFKVPAKGGLALETQLTQAEGASMWPTVSPDGRTVLFAMNKTPAATPPGNFQIYTVPLKGGGVTQLISDQNNYSSPMYNAGQNAILCAMQILPTTSTLNPPPPFQSSIVEIPLSNVKNPVTVAAPSAPSTDPLTGATTWSSYAHPRYLANDRVIVFDSSNFNSSPTPTGIQIYQWQRKSNTAAPFGFSVGAYEQIQGDQ